MLKTLQIIVANSILGLKPTGTELLGNTLLELGLEQSLRTSQSVVYIEDHNERYKPDRDKDKDCLNPHAIHDYSLLLMDEMSRQIAQGNFPLVLGGDCSILLGIMPALKQDGTYGLIFVDAHADFYAPEQSTTGEVADMDLAIVTGRGPNILSNIRDLKPYVLEEHMMHIGQRDEEEARKYGSDEISDTMIDCYSLAYLRSNGLVKTLAEISKSISGMAVKGLWLHFDTDVIADSDNPAVDYRLPGGLRFDEMEQLLRSIIATGKIMGMSVTIYNPKLDKNYITGKKIVACLSSVLK